MEKSWKMKVPGLWQPYRAATVREKVREKKIFSRSWKSQGILLQVSENELFLRGQGKSVLVREFLFSILIF